ncbi:MAG TPA: FAD-dependent oxidoreductase [Acetobacteraceae bacterium]|nr:FAD-dependent oxidoreductase [Acetobacteraceae bacterium]
MLQLLASAPAIFAPLAKRAHPQASPSLMLVEDASAIRHRMLLAFEFAEGETDPAERARLLTFVVIGGGQQGVEMASTLAGLAHEMLALELYSIAPDEPQIVLVEAGPRILPELPGRVAHLKLTGLDRRGVAVRLGAGVTSIAADHVVAGDERIETRTAIWAVGSEPPSGTVATPARRSRRDRLVGAWTGGLALCLRRLAGRPGRLANPA